MVDKIIRLPSLYWSQGACKYPLCACCCWCMYVCAHKCAWPLTVPPPLFLPPLLLLFLSSPSLLPIQAVKLSSFLLPSGRMKPSQTKHGQAARHSPRTHAKIYNKCTNVHPHTCPRAHAHMHALTHALGAGVRSRPTPHKQWEWQPRQIPANGREKQTESVNEPLINFLWPSVPRGNPNESHGQISFLYQTLIQHQVLLICSAWYKPERVS